MLKIMKWSLMIVILLMPAMLNAAFEYENLFDADIGAPILDVTTNPSKDLVFVLTPGEVVIYSMIERNVLDRIQVDKQYDRIAFHTDDKLVISSTQQSRISIVNFSRFYEIDLTDRAIKGPPDAKVTLVVFDDYQ